MPRGVYDRSKVKSQKTVKAPKAPKASKVIKAAKADEPKMKRKYTKRQQNVEDFASVAAKAALAMEELAGPQVADAGYSLVNQGSARKAQGLFMIANQVGSMMGALDAINRVAEKYKGDPNQEKLDNLADSLIELLHETFSKSTETILTPAVSNVAAGINVPNASLNNEVKAEAPKRRGRPPKVKPAETPAAEPALASVVKVEEKIEVKAEEPKAEVQNGQQTMTPLPQPVPFFSAPITQ